MSRNFVILLVVMCTAVAALLVLPKMRSGAGARAGASAPVDTAPPAPPEHHANGGTDAHVPPAHGTTRLPPVVVVKTNLTAPPAVVMVATNEPPEPPDTKPLPVLEKEYTATTNHDERLDIMMDISDAPGPEAIKTLSRLFDLETNTDLKVDLLDSLLGIEGQVEEKLLMLTKGAAKGLPAEVRQSAIDGLIDLDDRRVIPVLNGLLNDPDEEIRESAKDALEMIQAQPVKLK